MQPLVTIIIPTTLARKEFNDQIIKDYRAQDYPNKEVLFDYGHGCIGEKRNRLCKAAKGEIIIHFDSDDRYKPDWISRQVRLLLESEADMVGISQFKMIDYNADEGWMYTYVAMGVDYVAGATLCYRRSYWENNKFAEIQVGEDVVFSYGRTNGYIPKVVSGDYIDGFLCTMHEGNTSPRQIGNVGYRRLNEEEFKEVKSIWNLA